MAKVYLDSDESFTVANNNIFVYGTTGNEKVTISTGVTGTVIDQNTESILFTLPSSSFTFKQTGNKINVYDAAGTTLIASTPVQGDADGTVFTFSDGTASALLSAGVMTLGGKTVSPTAATPLSVFSGGSVVTISATGSSSAANGDFTYNVTPGSYIYTISDFGAGDKISFPAGNPASVSNSSYTDGAVDLTWSSGGQTAVIHLTGISAANDAKLNSIADFNSVFGLGTILPTSVTPGATPVQVPVSAAGSSDASTANNIYSIAPGNYTYTIAGFGSGDVLKGPAGNTVSVSQNSYTDGMVDIAWSSASGTTVTVHLIGISSANEVRLNSAADFNTVFGAGTIV